MAAYRRVYDSRHLQADCQEPGSAPEPYVGNRVWATFTTKVIVIKFAECGTSSPYLSPLLLFWSNVGLLPSDPSDDFQWTATLGCSAAEHPGYALHGNTLHGYATAALDAADGRRRCSLVKKRFQFLFGKCSVTDYRHTFLTHG